MRKVTQKKRPTQDFIQFNVSEKNLNFYTFREFLNIFCEILTVERENSRPITSDTSHYQVHKIQPITKRHVLLLGFAITIQKPIEICQVSCKNQSHISACKQ